MDGNGHVLSLLAAIRRASSRFSSARPDEVERLIEAVKSSFAAPRTMS
jgi:hypothetical protein